MFKIKTIYIYFIDTELIFNIIYSYSIVYVGNSGNASWNNDDNNWNKMGNCKYNFMCNTYVHFLGLEKYFLKLYSPKKYDYTHYDSKLFDSDYDKSY